ncbi:hypothetical protein [Desulfovibrio ferrophilus]|uniref:Lipid-A-disaccharide synthase n=1 Tax=Desulfovibrio ferrophilus TaxID=241368 RepID=A0A2Z6B247_9BACT|nr:hypothetical protein [Desulfovibrio ferrophilus]BBD09574.1 putative uncharacterized protein [Desulfovibrio ferrophilus]
MNILFCMSYPRAAANILPAVLELCTNHQMYFFQYRKMASHFPFGGAGVDTRPDMIRALLKAGATNLGEASQAHSNTADTYSIDFKQATKHLPIDLAIFDENVGKLRWGTPLLYSILKRRGIPVVGCQEGCVENDTAGLQRQALNLGICYDYALCIGNYDHSCLLKHNPNLEKRLFAVGLPSNDQLGTIDHKLLQNKKHILLVPSWTKLSGKEGRFKAMTDEVIEQSGIYTLARNKNISIVIKEKSKASQEYAFKHLETETVRVTMDETETNNLIARAKYVIGAPSTLLLKPLQLGIPVVVLSEPYMGQFGVFQQYNGLTPLNQDKILQSFSEQERQPYKDLEFIEKAIAGGSDFSCTQKFCQAIENILMAGSTYQGPIKSPLPGVKGYLLRYPRTQSFLTSQYARIKKWMLTQP